MTLIHASSPNARAKPSMSNQRILVCGAGGFIGVHLVRHLKCEGHYVVGVDLKQPEYAPSEADEFIIGDLRSPRFVKELVRNDFDLVVQLAANMGGANFIFSGENDADIMHDSALINLNVVDASAKGRVKRLFFASSACVYPWLNQTDPLHPDCREESAYPASPDSEYGWEKIFAERLYSSYQRNYGIEVRIARLHNVYGPEGTWRGGREKAPAALCRKVAEAAAGESIEVWGDGQQTRSFLFITDCVRGIWALCQSDYSHPVNIGSAESVSIEELARLIIARSGKRLSITYVDGPQGVRGRTSDNRLAADKLGFEPEISLRCGVDITYEWIHHRMIREASERGEVALEPTCVTRSKVLSHANSNRSRVTPRLK